MTKLSPLGPVWILSLLFNKTLKKSEEQSNTESKSVNKEQNDIYKTNIINIDQDINENVQNIEPRNADTEKDKKGYHKIVKGDTLYRIANNYKVSVSDLIKQNPDLKTDKNGNKVIEEGSYLKIPENAVINIKPQKTDKKERTWGKWEIEKSKGAFSVMSKFNLYREELQKINPEIDLDNIKTETVFKVPAYEIKSGDTLAKIAKEHDITEKMLKELNPNFKGLKVGSFINVPKKVDDDLGLGDIEIEVEETVAEETKTYTVKKGDTLSEIAVYNKVPVWALMITNNIKDDKLIYDKQVLEIPSPDDLKALTNAKKEAEKVNKAKPSETNVEHRVAKNEALSKIAEKYGVPTWSIIAKNNIENPDKISVGMKLEVPDRDEVMQLRNINAKNKSTPKVKTKTVKRVKKSKKSNGNNYGAISPNMGLVTHRVKPKDSITSLAKEYGVSVKDLAAYNNLKGISLTLPLSKQKVTTLKVVGNQTAVKVVTGVSQEFLDDLISLESKRRDLHDDGCGYMTVGIGHNTKAHNDAKRYRGRNINDTEIYSLLARDIIGAQKVVKKHLGNKFNKLSTHQKEALYSLIFNTGGLNSSPSLVKAIKEGKHAKAAQQFDHICGTVNGKKKVMGGLAKRRFVEIAKYVKGSKLNSREMKTVMAKTQEIYDKGYASISKKNNRVDYNAYAKKFLGEFIDKGYIKIKT